MKEILKNKITSLIKKGKALSFPFSIPVYAPNPQIIRIGMGAIAGIILITLYSFIFSSQNSTSHKTFRLDSELLSLSDLFKQDEKKEDRQTKKASGFHHFETNKNPLSDPQKTAIKDNLPRLSILVNGIGQQKKFLDLIEKKLPKSVTLALSPYTKTYNAVARHFHHIGFETWLSLSTHTLSLSADNGEYALSPAHNFALNTALMERQVQGKSNITGIMIPEKSLLVQSNVGWAEISQEIFAEGFAIFDPTEKSLSSSFFYYQDKPAPYLKGDIVIDANTSSDHFTAELDKVKTRLETEKNLIISLSLYTPATLDILTKWVDSLQTEGITIIPLSAQAKLQ